MQLLNKTIDAQQWKYLHVIDVFDGGPELVAITVFMLVDRLLVKLIKEPFESPDFYQKQNKITQKTTC